MNKLTMNLNEMDLNKISDDQPNSNEEILNDENLSNEDLNDEDLNEENLNEGNLNDEDLNEENKKKLNPEEKTKSKFKTGVVYLSKIPVGRNYTRIREIFEKFAPIGNIYLVPDKQANSKLQKKGKQYKNYKEGFVEFKRKKDAKNFSNIFNGTTLKSSGSSQKSKSLNGFIWDIRYLHR